MYELLGGQIQARKCYFQKVPKAMEKRVMESLCIDLCIQQSNPRKDGLYGAVLACLIAKLTSFAYKSSN